MNKITLFICLVFGVKLGYSQEQVVRHLSVKDGLPSATVYCILQDKKGYIWFGTENGASRYDGTSFVNFTTKDGLTDNSILYMNEDQQGRIWMHGFKGSPCYYSNEKMCNAKNDSFLASLPNWGFVLNSKQVKDGPLYFSTDIGIIKIHQNKYQKRIIPLNPKNQYKAKVDSNIWAYIPNKKNYSRYFWDIRENILYWSNPSFITEGKQYPGLQNIKVPPSYREPIYQVKIDQDFWMCSYMNGVLKIANIQSAQPKMEEFLKGIQVSMVLKDTEGNLWFSTLEKGVMQILANQQNMKYYPKEPYLVDENILKLTKTNSGIWAGLTKNRLASINSNKFKLLEIPHHNDDKKSSVYDIVNDPAGNILVATSFELFQMVEANKQWKFIPINNKRGAISTNNKALCIDKKRRLIVCEAILFSIFNYLDKQNRYVFDTTIRIENNRFFSCLSTQKGEVFFSSRNGLFKLKNKLLVACKPAKEFRDEPIIKMAELPNSHLVLVTRNKGILIYDQENIIQTIGENEGMSSNICNKVWVQNNLLYVATARGINILKNQKGKWAVIQQIGKEEGLLSDEINDISTLNKTIFAATASGLNSFTLTKPSFSAGPPIYFNSITNNSLPLKWNKKARLKQAESSLEISFRALTFQAPHKTEYAYRMIGLNDAWKRSFNNRIEYPSLPAGSYIFEVKAKKQNSYWSEPIQFSLEVISPFYKKIEFILFAYSAVLLGIMWAIYTYLKLKKKEKRKKQLIQSKLESLEFQALNAMMNPHFIFNALNSIQQYLNENNALEANKFLSKFATLIRMNMESVMKRSILLEDELERLKLYLRFEKLRLSNKLNYTLHISKEVDIENIFIPPLVLQPLVENAIWHGIIPNQILNIEIHIRPINQETYCIEITDDGIGFEHKALVQPNNRHEPHQSRGLEFTKQRLGLWTHLYQKEFSLSISKKAPNKTHTGTIVCLQMPVIYEELGG